MERQVIMDKLRQEYPDADDHWSIWKSMTKQEKKEFLEEEQDGGEHG